MSGRSEVVSVLEIQGASELGRLSDEADSFRSGETEPEREAFVKLFLQVQQDLFRYIAALVPDRADAQEVLQETALTLWTHHDDYDPERPFLPWAKQFAYFKSLEFCRANSKYSPFLAGDLIETLVREREEIEPLLGERRRALKYCLKKLTAEQRRLLDVRYGNEQTIAEFAEETGRSVHMMRKHLVQLRRRLLDCITRRLAAEGVS